jgi:chromosome segregation ATPase
MFIPLLNKIRFDESPGIEKCMQFVFGSTLLCKNIGVATQLARTLGEL